MNHIKVMGRRDFMRLTARDVRVVCLADLPQVLLESPWVPWYAYCWW